MRLSIAVIDDKREVLLHYKEVLEREGHIVETFSDLFEGIEQVVRGRFDAIFLDNHFEVEGREADYALEELERITSARADCIIVLMSSKPFEPWMVRAVVDHKIAFFVENFADADDIRRVASQLVLAKTLEVEAVKSAIEALRDEEAGGEPLIRRVWSALFADGGDAGRVQVEYLEDTGEDYLLEEMEYVDMVLRGEKTSIEERETREVTVGEQVRASSRMEYALSLGDSPGFLSTPLGARFCEVLEQHAGFSRETTLSSSFVRGTELRIDDEEVRRDPHRKEFYEGLLHRRHRMSVRVEYSPLGLVRSQEIDCFVPTRFVKAAVLLDEANRVLADGRNAYRVWHSPAAYLRVERNRSSRRD